MKRCPSCQSTYTDDSLRYCLNDGTLLSSVTGDSGQAPFDAEASTLRINSTPGTDAAPPTEIMGQADYEAIKPPPVLPMTTPHLRRATHETQNAPFRQKSNNPLVMAALGAIVVLLLIIAGVGIALLMRDPASSNSGNQSVANTTTSQNGNQSANPNANLANDRSANSYPSGDNSSRDDSAPLKGNAVRTEAKILKGQALDESDLAGLSRSELSRLRNTVYARHGRVFNRPEIQQYFDKRPWYKPREDYTDDMLTTTDRYSINLIRVAEDRTP
jgi:hypothetical protein